MEDYSTPTTGSPFMTRSLDQVGRRQDRDHPIFPDRPSRTVPSKYSKGSWRLVECLDTGLVYLANPVEYERLESEFAWEKTYEKERADRNLREPVYSKLSAWVKAVRRKVRKTPKIESLPLHLARMRFQNQSTIRLLDVGCGRGSYPRKIARQLARELNKRVIPEGIEISETLARISNLSLSELGGDVVQASALVGMNRLDDDSLDLVVMHSFLEHEINPLELLRACAGKMAGHGLLIIKVPNYRCWNRLLRQEKWCGFRYPDHVNYFSPDNVKTLLEEAGLKIYRMNFFDRIPTSDNLWVIAERAS